jgi:predicted Zn finger-like uncharacterized protein
MVVQCSSCLTEFELDPQKVPAAGVRARCSVCSAVIAVPAPGVSTEHAAPAPSHPQQGDTESEKTAETAAAKGSEKAPETEPEHSAGAATSAAPEISEAEAQAPRHEPQVEHEVERQAEAEPEQAPETSHPAAEPVSAVNEPATPKAESSVAGAPHPLEPPPHAPPAREEPSQAPEAFSPPAPHPGWSRPSIAPEAAHVAPSPVEAESGQRRPINPFLTRDPALRAKRLARALVSDIVAYHPARHAEGLRDGTLKTLFRDEIKKSYEEYVDQVGRDFAGSTTHFQDALNDVLASGRKLF